MWSRPCFPISERGKRMTGRSTNVGDSGSIPSWARKGAKVVCVDDGPGRRPCLFPGLLDGLTKGRVYTVRRVAPDWYYGHPVIFLVEFVRPIDGEPSETGYDIRRFRPLVSTKTEAEDLAKFSHHLTQRQPEGLDA
jgi:hypothetical protein